MYIPRGLHWYECAFQAQDATDSANNVSFLDEVLSPCTGVEDEQECHPQSSEVTASLVPI